MLSIAQAEYNDFEQQINKLKATQAADKASDDTDIKAAEDSLAQPRNWK